MEALIDGVPVALIGVEKPYQILLSDDSLVIQLIIVEVAVVLVANDAGFLQSRLEKVPGWVERHWPDVEVDDRQIELR